MFASIGTWLAKSALMQSPLGGLLKMVPRKAWFVVAGLLALAGAYLWHQHVARKAVADAYASGKADESARIAKEALALKQRVDTLNAQITAALKEKNREENVRIAHHADDVLMRGPGKATCASDTGISGAPGGHVSPAGPTDAGLAGLRDQERQPLIALPFAPTVDFAKGHDQCQADLRAYREWGDKILKAWPK